MRSNLGRFHRPMSRGLVNNMLTMNNLGDGSTLSLDFTTMGGVLDPRLTFTRSTTATYINSSGYVTSAAINAPRFDYSPTNIGEPRGLLVEGSAINIATNSTFSSGWLGGGNVTTAFNTLDVLDPAGTNTATKCTLANSTFCSKFEAIAGLAASTTYTWSYWIRGTAGNTQRIYSVTAAADLVAQTAYTYSTSGWTRVTTTFTTTAVVSTVYVYPINRNSGIGEVLYIWGAQLELGSGASSYIPTGASQVTRNGDSCVMTGTNFSSWFAGATEGVLFAQYEKQRSQSGNTAHDFCAVGSRYNTGEGLILYHSNTNLYPTAILWPTIGGAVFGGGIATAIPSVTKQALKWFAANDVTLYSNGVVGTTGTGSGTVTPAMLSFGANSSTGTEATRDWLNACIRRVKFYPTALSDAAIQTLTTP